MAHIIYFKNPASGYQGQCTKQEWDRWAPNIRRRFQIMHEDVDGKATASPNAKGDEEIPDPPEVARALGQKAKSESTQEQADADAGDEKQAKRGRPKKNKN